MIKIYDIKAGQIINFKAFVTIVIKRENRNIHVINIVDKDYIHNIDEFQLIGELYIINNVLDIINNVLDNKLATYSDSVFYLKNKRI